MEKTNIIVEAINVVFDTICIIYDDTEFNFNSGKTLIQKLVNAFEVAKTINAKEVTMEIWNATSKWNREDKIVSLMNSKFDRLITWKPDAHKIEDFNNELQSDLNSFFEKQMKINWNYSDFDKSNIRILYKQIGHRLLKANLDLDKVFEQLMKMEEAEHLRIDDEELYIIKSNNIKIHPNKLDEFAVIVKDLYENDFFIPVDSSILLSKNDVLITFGEFLHANLNSGPKVDKVAVIIEQPVKLEGQKSFSDYLLHEKRDKLAEEIRKEFSTEKGKAIRLLIAVMENDNPPLIIIGTRQGKDVYKSMCDYFNWDIGSYQSVFNYKINSKYDQKDLENTKARLNHILNSLKY